MNSAEFRKCGYELIDFVADYMDNVEKRQPLANVEPGYLTKLIPKSPPEKPEPWKNIMKDLEPCVMQRLTHWQHPHFHAYFCSGNSWPSVLGDMLSNAFAISCSTWASCPVATELETIVLDWVAKFLNFPTFFYSTFSNSNSRGGGCIQGSASECVFLAMVSAREYAIAKLVQLHPNKERAVLKSQIVAYCNNQCHSCVEKAAIMACVTLRVLDPDDQGVLRAETLQRAIEEDIKAGLVPFYVNAILGSTSITCFDDLLQIGPICKTYDIWLHTDAAYAGTGFVCPELRYLSRGLRYAWSININTNKWMLTNFDCSLFWVRYKHLLIGCMSGYDASLYKVPVEEYRFWGIPTTRRFRAMKLWCVLRSYGVRGLQKHVRNHCALAKRFENHLRRDERFDIIGETRVGLCCFAYKGQSDVANKLTQRLIEALNATRHIHMVPGMFRHIFLIRFALCYEYAEKKHIDYAWEMVDEHARVINRLYGTETEELEKQISSHSGIKFHLPPPHVSELAKTILKLLRPFHKRLKEGSTELAVKSTSLRFSSESFGSILTGNSDHFIDNDLLNVDEEKLEEIEKELVKLTTAVSEHVTALKRRTV